MRTRGIGPVEVGAVGLGAMPLSVEGRPDEAHALRTIHAALDAGVSLIDTADAYHLPTDEPGHNERLVAKALAAYSGGTDHVLVATKGGHVHHPDGRWTIDGSPAHLRRAAVASLRALGVERIGLYQYHRPDPTVPFEDSIGALKELRDEGKVWLVGISNASVDQIETARRVLGADGLAAVQNELSPAFRSSETELAHCSAAGIAFLPWSPLGGIGRAGDLGGRDGPFRAVAQERGVSPQRLAIAWLLGKAPVVVPIPGARRPESIVDSAGAADLDLAPDEIARLDAGTPATPS